MPTTRTRRDTSRAPARRRRAACTPAELHALRNCLRMTDRMVRVALAILSDHEAPPRPRKGAGRSRMP